MDITRQRLSRCAAAFIALAIAVIPLAAQDVRARAPSSADVFEVASIKPRTAERAGPVASSPDRFIRPDVTLRDLIRYAYNLQEFQIERGPGWLRSNRFDVNAKAAAPPSSVDGMRALVGRLLQDRFGLKARTETREMPMYELVIARRDGRRGDGLRPSTLDCESLMSSGETTARAPAADDRVRCDLRFRPKMVSGADGRPSIYSMTLTLQGVRMSRLATLLQNEVERIIVDKTGLDGTFDLELEFAPQARRPAGLPPGPAPAPSDGPPLQTALQEQLGLRLESVRGPVPVLVIESAELPTPD